MIAVLLGVTGGGLCLGSAVVGRHRAQAVADLAAVTAAGWLPSGVTAACERAAQVVRRMRANQLRCGADGLDVVVSVEVAPVIRVPGLGPASAVARAGPATPT